jgi:sialate O-acetylesterase
MKKISLLFFILFLTFVSLQAQIRLPAIFCDHMVLQQQSDVAIWGWSSPSSEMTIDVSWDKDRDYKFKAANTSSWSTNVKTPKAGGPFVITIKNKDYQVVLNDVMIGEVWICSGQSNMEWSVLNGSEDGKAEMPKADYPNIRFFQVNKTTADFPQDHGEGKWEKCTPETMQRFSSVGYFFGKKLTTELKAPIGLINVSWGGTPAEVWTPKGKVDNDPALKASSLKLEDHPGWPHASGIVYNSMIRPLVPYGIAGAIWYQGEANTGNSDTYSKLMQTLIESWRADFGKEFPFYYVQIAPYTYKRKFEGALVREQQCKTLSVPKTGMVIITDEVDDVSNIHPKFKKPVGDRLANYALADTYKKGILGYQSPVYKSMVVDRNRIKISFEYASIGLISHNGDPTQFTIAGEDKKFYPAIAKIDGGTVIVSAKEVKVPVAVRFCFDNTSIPNLFNKEGLPVSIFRTDDWELDVTP